jgi:hypothetical protein
VLEPDFSDQGLKAITTNGRRPGVTLILINDVNALPSPSQAQGALHQVILAHSAGGVVAHLDQRGLAHVDQGVTVQVVRLDLAQ